MKTLIAVIVGILVFIGCLYGASSFINYIVSGFTDPNWKTMAKIVVWFFSVSFILIISITLAGVVGAIIDDKIK